MTIAWMLYLLLVGSLIVCAAGAIEGVMRRMMVPARWVWVAAIGAIVGLAIMAPRNRELVMPATLRVAGPTPMTATTLPMATTGVVAHGVDRITQAITSAIATVASRVPAFVVLPVAVLWGASSVVLLLVIITVNRRVNRARRAWPLAEMNGTPVRITSDVGPAVIGLARPEIVVPRWLLNRTHDEQQLVIAHEREHVIAHDQLLPIGAWIVAALLPWHPAVWWALSRLRLAIELDCDARVLEGGAKAACYGSLLIDIAGQCAGHRVGALALADRSSHLERRLLAMKPARSRFTFVRSTVLGAIAMSAILVACESRLPTSEDISSMDVARAEKAAEDTRVFAKESAASRQYVINDQPVTAAQAHDIAAANIASVSLATRSPDGVDKVFIKTRNPQFSTMTDSALRLAKIMVDTGHFRTRDTYTNTTPSGLALTRQNPPAAKQFTALVYIDGQLSSERAIAEIPRDQIASVDILKGDAARSRYSDPAAANGVIIVKTKHGAPPVNPPEKR